MFCTCNVSLYGPCQIHGPFFETASSNRTIPIPSKDAQIAQLEADKAELVEALMSAVNAVSVCAEGTCKECDVIWSTLAKHRKAQP